MGGLHVAREGAYDFFLTVEHDVDYKGQVGLARGVDHVFVHHVVAEVARAGVGVVERAAAVVGHYRLVRGYARQHGLAPAGEAGKEVRLDEALGYQQVGLGGDLVYNAPAAAGQGAYLL